MLVWFTKFYLSFNASLTADERRTWTNYENNRNEYLIIGAVVRSEYSNSEVTKSHPRSDDDIKFSIE